MKTSLFLYIPINLKEKTCTYLSFFVSLYTNFSHSSFILSNSENSSFIVV